MNTDVGYLFAFTTAILGSFHCVGMCGALVSAFFLRMGDRRSLFSYVNYHTGRIMVYVTLGVVVGIIGSAMGKTTNFAEVQRVFMMVAGVVVVFMGLDMLKVVPWSLPIDRTPVSRLKKLYKRAVDKGPLIGFFMGGVFNGFIPCGLLYSVLIAAATTANPAKSGLMMLIFGLGTLPSMMFVSLVVGKIGARVRGIFFKLAAVTVIMMGLWIIYRAFNLFLTSGDPNAPCH